MKKGFVLVATIVAVILIGNVIVAYAQNGNPPARPGTGVCPSGVTCPFSGTMPYSGMMGGRGMMGNQAYGYMMGDNGMHEVVMTAVAKKLGLTYDELTTALQTQTMAQLAEAKGVALTDLQKVATDAGNAELDKLVAAGTLTQAQADFMKSRMQSMRLINLGNCPMQNGQPGSYGRGMMGGRGVSGGMMRGYAQPTGPQG